MVSILLIGPFPPPLHQRAINGGTISFALGAILPFGASGIGRYLYCTIWFAGYMKLHDLTSHLGKHREKFLGTTFLFQLCSTKVPHQAPKVAELRSSEAAPVAPYGIRYVTYCHKAVTMCVHQGARSGICPASARYGELWKLGRLPRGNFHLPLFHYIT